MKKATEIAIVAAFLLVLIYATGSFLLWNLAWPVEAIIGVKGAFISMGTWPVWARWVFLLGIFSALTFWLQSSEFK